MEYYFWNFHFQKLSYLYFIYLIVYFKIIFFISVIHYILNLNKSNISDENKKKLNNSKVK